VLSVIDVPEPHAGEGQVRVAVRAAGLNPFDAKVRRGGYLPKHTLPSLQGSEFAGDVDEVGGGVTDWKVGDEVLGWIGRGAQAEHVVPLGPGAGVPAANDGADGTVSWYDEAKGFGFVTPDVGGEDVFVHVRSLADGVTGLVEGDRVTYEVVRGDKGPQARGVRRVRTTAPAPAAAAPPRRTPGHGAAAAPGEGTVTRYDPDRGFGFITPKGGGEDLFVHFSVLIGTSSLEKGDKVRYAIRQSDRGPQADRVERV
jgi:CspA family cold shock protein